MPSPPFPVASSQPSQLRYHLSVGHLKSSFSTTTYKCSDQKQNNCPKRQNLPSATIHTKLGNNGRPTSQSSTPDTNSVSSVDTDDEPSYDTHDPDGSGASNLLPMGACSVSCSFQLCPISSDCLLIARVCSYFSVWGSFCGLEGYDGHRRGDAF